MNAAIIARDPTKTIFIESFGGRESGYIIAGTKQGLRRLALTLAESVEALPDQLDEPILFYPKGLTISDAGGSRKYVELVFKAERDLKRYYMRSSGIRHWWRQWKGCLLLVAVGVLALIGLWTIFRWLL